MDSPPPYPATSTQKVQQHPQPQPQEQPPPYSSLNLDSPLQRPRGQRPPPPYPFPRSERPPSPPRLDDWDSLECEGDSSYLGRFPGVAFCPKCDCHVTTKVASVPSFAACVAGLLLFMFGCFIFVCLPCCLESMRNTMHFCPNCNSMLGCSRRR